MNRVHAESCYWILVHPRSPRNTLIGTSNAVTAVVLDNPSTSTLPVSSSTASSSASQTTSNTANSQSAPTSTSSVSPSTRLPDAPTTPPNSKSTRNMPAIVGAVVGSILLVSLLAVLLIFLHRRRKQIRKRLTFHRDMMVQRRASRHPSVLAGGAIAAAGGMAGGIVTGGMVVAGGGPGGNGAHGGEQGPMSAPPTLIRITRPSGEGGNPFEPSGDSEEVVRVVPLRRADVEDGGNIAGVGTAAAAAKRASSSSTEDSASAYSRSSSPESMDEASASSSSQEQLTSASTVTYPNLPPTAPLVPLRRPRIPSLPHVLPPIPRYTTSNSSHGMDVDLERGLESELEDDDERYPDVPRSVGHGSPEMGMEDVVVVPRRLPDPSAAAATAATAAVTGVISPRGPRPSMRRAAPIPPVPGSAPPMPIESLPPTAYIPPSTINNTPFSAPKSAPISYPSIPSSSVTKTTTTTSTPDTQPLQPQRTPRQLQLTQRIAMLQAQMADFHSRRDSGGRNVLQEMHREMMWLREHENGEWALGKTDEMPPGHQRYLRP
ncbi:hypothetical protein D9613_001281 [Agrocybe pediades]|uniref:Transmembrane protein n=1 Tax=Agrocybe pediades TaxID=84607 RepID=A0A8H4R8V3_9AGAR|nr:hypothetical protein D9613_001281 [Agrocybe pediades]